MIDEKKIKAATDVVFADMLSPKANICMSAGFIRGIECFNEAICKISKASIQPRSCYTRTSTRKTSAKQFI